MTPIGYVQLGNYLVKARYDERQTNPYAFDLVGISTEFKTISLAAVKQIDFFAWVCSRSTKYLFVH